MEAIFSHSSRKPLSSETLLSRIETGAILAAIINLLNKSSNFQLFNWDSMQWLHVSKESKTHFSHAIDYYGINLIPKFKLLFRNNKK